MPSCATAPSCGWSRSRRSRRPTWRWSASTCSRRRPRRGAGDRAVGPRRAGDHRRDPAPGRPGARVEPHIVSGWWKDTGRLDDMLAANRLVLDTIEGRRRGRADRLAGRRPRRDRARRAAGALRRARPSDHRRRRAADRLLRRSLHGDRRGLRDPGAEVEHSILLRGCSVRDLDGRIESSLLGRNVRIGRDHRQPRAYRFMVGDNCEIGIL